MKQLLMHRVTACNYLDMDEFTFEAYIVPIVTSLRFGDHLYYLSSQVEEAVYTLIESSEETEVHLHLVDQGGGHIKTLVEKNTKKYTEKNVCICPYAVEPARVKVWCDKCEAFQKHSRFTEED